MGTNDKIATVFSNARELVRRGEPKAARAYVLVLLEGAVKTYQSASTILQKARAAAFLDQWIAVSRELYEGRISDFVLKSFGLPLGKGEPAARPIKQPERKSPRKAPEKKEPALEDDLDLAGLVEEAKETQGWCADVFEHNRRAVVRISLTGPTFRRSGTGFIISKKGYLLTNDHVVYDEASGGYFSKVFMEFDGVKKKIGIEVLYSDRSADVALCTFDPAEAGEFGCVRRIADYSALLQGADCLVIGNGFGMGLAPFSGVVRFTKNSDGDLVYTAPSNPGDSGGPVFNRRGECIGINKSRTTKVDDTHAEGYANATPMDTIDALLGKWTKAGGIEL